MLVQFLDKDKKTLRVQHLLLKCKNLDLNCGYRNNNCCLYNKKTTCKNIDGSRSFEPNYCRFEK